MKLDCITQDSCDLLKEPTASTVLKSPVDGAMELFMIIFAVDSAYKVGIAVTCPLQSH